MNADAGADHLQAAIRQLCSENHGTKSSCLSIRSPLLALKISASSAIFSWPQAQQPALLCCSALVPSSTSPRGEESRGDESSARGECEGARPAISSRLVGSISSAAAGPGGPRSAARSCGVCGGFSFGICLSVCYTLKLNARASSVHLVRSRGCGQAELHVPAVHVLLGACSLCDTRRLRPLPHTIVQRSSTPRRYGSGTRRGPGPCRAGRPTAAAVLEYRYSTRPVLYCSLVFQHSEVYDLFLN